MLYMGRGTKRNIVLFLVAFLAADVVSILQPARFPVRDLASLMYCAIIMAWALTIRRRVVQGTIRRCLVAVSALFLMLFLLRMARYFMFFGDRISRWLWYGYYVPLMAVPVLFFFCSLCIGRADADRPLRRAVWLWLPCAALIAAVWTNDLHGLAFRSDGPLTPNAPYSYGWLYYAIVLWQVGLAVAAFVILLRRCSLSRCRRMAWLPILPFAFSAALLILYAYAGGAPVIHGYKLYNMQEAYCFGFVGFWECCVQIGLVPVNTGYGELFAMSSVRAELAQADGRVVYRSQSEEPTAVGHIRLRSAPISGGSVLWEENHTAIDEMNADLEEAAARIEEENDLIVEENAILAEKARYETQNRIYNRIAWRTHDQLVRIGELLDAETDSEEDFRRNLAMCTILGAYVKRRGNLAIMAENAEAIPARDVVLAMRESMEYMGLYGVTCGVSGVGDALVPAEAALLCYDLFEAVTEAALPAMTAMAAHISTEDGLQLRLMLDQAAVLPDPSWEAARLAAQGGAFATAHEGGDIYIRLSFGKEAAAC